MISARFKCVSGIDMEQDLILLESIKNGVWLIAFFMGIVAIANLVRAVAICKEKFSSNSEFSDKASVIYEEGDFSKLIRSCEAHLGDDPYAYWYLGKAYYGLEKYELALEYFNKTLRLRPQWQDEYIKPYITQIESINENH